MGVLEPKPAAASVKPDLLLACRLRRFGSAQPPVGSAPAATTARSTEAARPRSDPRRRRRPTRSRKCPPRPAEAHDERLAPISASVSARRAPADEGLCWWATSRWRAGRAAIVANVPKLRLRWRLEFVVVNGENAAGGFGVAESDVGGIPRRRRRCDRAGQSRLRPARRPGSSWRARAPDLTDRLLPRERRGTAPPPVGNSSTGGVMLSVCDPFLDPGACSAPRGPVPAHKAGKTAPPPLTVRLRGGDGQELPRRGDPARNRPSGILSTAPSVSQPARPTSVPSADARILPRGAGFLAKMSA